jgi:hypothetical protein
MKPATAPQRKVLCISPRFPPSNGADCHRLRLLLPHLHALGWKAEVLAVDPRDTLTPEDPWLEARLPPEVQVHRVRAWPLRTWGGRSLWQRALVPLYCEGSRLLEQGHHDVVLFSTTEFLVHVLGPLWRRRFGVPFCMDFQDPWVTDYYREHPGVAPPGGRLKFGVIQMIDRAAERAVVRRCSGFMAVSGAYLDALRVRYGDAAMSRPKLVAAFPADPEEFAGVGDESTGAASEIWRYIGRGGGDMAFAGSAFFRAWRQALDAGDIAGDAIRFEAFGTSYAAAAAEQKATFAPLADAEGVAHVASEQTARIGYGEMLSKLRSSDALVVFGSDDPAYSPSKIYPYLLSGKRLLVICHRRSPLVGMIGQVGGATCINFDESTTVDLLAKTIHDAWFAPGSRTASNELDRTAFDRFTAATQAKAVCAWLDAVACRGAPEMPVPVIV